MFITKLSVDRRTFLRGAGVAVALPFLDAMVPALGAAPSAPKRLGFVYVPNGMWPPNFHPEGNGGTNYVTTPVLRAIESLREHTVVVSGLSNMPVAANDQGGGVHTRNHAGWLSGVLPLRTEGANITSAKTADQYAADVLGAGTSLRSLELTLESNYQVGNCEAGYSCAYLNSTSWRAPNAPLPHETDPRVVFQRLFGDGGSVSARLAQMQKDRSILDSVLESISAIKQRLGVSDQTVMSDYLDSVREVEQRVQRAERANDSSPLPAVAQPSGMPEEHDEHAKLLFDLLHLAYQGDVTRVSCLQIGRELSGRTYPWIGVPEAHHGVSHHQRDPHNIAQKTKIDVYNLSLFTAFLQKLKDTREGDGTVLDHSLFLYGAGMGDPDKHTPLELPCLLAGGAHGQLKGGRHIKYPDNTPLMNLLLTILAKVEVQVDKMGDSTGLLTGL
ncbi:MAG: DUF1552 domain-containing protein [Acidimicrobiia bacterium]|nr:DUF1552 domain-containing protein [Acidimicrobiia bacterium]